LLLLQGVDPALRVLDSAGAWIARFHGLTAAQTGFNPDPHVNWIRKSIAAHKSGARQITDCDGLRALLPDLDALADKARGALVRRAITHRDFHLRNLLLRKHGRTYGIDFENAARDECLRDLLFFLCDCAKVQTAAPSQASLRADATALLRAYGQPLADPAVRRFFQLAFAMATWAGFDDRLPPGPKRRRTVEVIRLLASADDLFSDA
jgi:aminoglycoside phosphotransferase (APT) family kinase protein